VSPLRSAVSDQDHVRGDPSAPVVLVEYGDFECPHCAKAYAVVKALEGRFRDRLCVVYRHFPLTQAHPHAEHAAEAAEGAGSQGRFWPMHDALYDHHEALDDADLVAYAEGVGVSADVITDAWLTRRYAARIRQDFLGGIRSGVNGTPSFFINGAKYEGDYDVPSMSEAIEGESVAQSEG
jgi:protein-disulfide isomerase